LHSVKENGYTIFVVKGTFPESFPELHQQYRFNQRWYTFQDIEKEHKQSLANKNYKLNIGGTDERDMEKAIKESLK